MAKKRKWTDEQLIELVPKSYSYHDVLKGLGLKLSGGSHSNIKLKIKQLNLDVSHFTGQGWCTGDKHQDFIKRFVEIPIEDVLVKESFYQNTPDLKKRLFKLNLLKNQCYICGMLPEWQNKPITLTLDHIDGDRSNNSIENLRILCPNCHSQTDTFTGRNKTKKCDKKCKECGINLKKDKRKFCSINCSNKYNGKLPKKNKIDWPPTDILIKMVEESSYLATSKQLGVSDKAVKKRIKNHPFYTK